MTDLGFPVLRPMKLSELLDQAIRLYRRNFLQFIGIVAIPYIPLMILQAASSILTASSLQGLTASSSPASLFSNGNYWLGVGGSLIFVILQLFLVHGLATAALTRAISDGYIGQPTGILAAYRHLGGSVGRLIGALLWLGLIGLVLVIWLIIPCVGWLSGPGLLAFVTWVVLPLVAPVVVLEKHGAIASVRRAWDLSRTRFWWLIGFAFILYLFAALVISGPTLLISSALRFLAISGSNPVSQQFVLSTLIQTVVSMITSLLYLPLQLCAITVVYFDLRVRSEGLDLALQAAPVAEPMPGGVLAVAPAGPQARFITGKDALNFVLLTVGFVAFYSLLVGALLGLGAALPLLFTPSMKSSALRPALVAGLIMLMAAFIPAVASAAGEWATRSHAGTEAFSEKQYWELVESSRQTIAQLNGATPDKIKGGLNDLTNQWQGFSAVTLADGKSVSIDNSYILSALTAQEPDLYKVQTIFTTLETAHRIYPTHVFTSSDLDGLKEVLARPEFRGLNQRPDPFKQWLQNLWARATKWLGELLQRLFGSPSLSLSSPNFSPLVIAAIAILGLILFLAARSIYSDFAAEASLDESGKDLESALTSDRAFEKAQALSREGDYRSAVRYLCLSCLLVLDERGLLRYDRSKTNREVLRSVSSSPELAQPLRDVLEVFDKVWYGYHALDEDSFRHYSQRVQELKEKRN